MQRRKNKSKPKYSVDVVVTDDSKPGTGFINVVFSNEPIQKSKTKQKPESPSFTLPSKALSELAAEIARNISSPFFKIRDPKLAQLIRNDISRAIARGETNGELALRLSKLINDKELAMDITVTEGVFAYSAGVVTYGELSGGIGKEWNATMLKDTCDYCSALAYKQVELKAKFGKQDQIGHPPLHPGCRCCVRIMYSNENLT